MARTFKSVPIAEKRAYRAWSKRVFGQTPGHGANPSPFFVKRARRELRPESWQRLLDMKRDVERASGEPFRIQRRKRAYSIVPIKRARNPRARIGCCKALRGIVNRWDNGLDALTEHVEIAAGRQALAHGRNPQILRLHVPVTYKNNHTGMVATGSLSKRQRVHGNGYEYLFIPNGGGSPMWVRDGYGASIEPHTGRNPLYEVRERKGKGIHRTWPGRYVGKVTAGSALAAYSPAYKRFGKPAKGAEYEILRANPRHPRGWKDLGGGRGYLPLAARQRLQATSTRLCPVCGQRIRITGKTTDGRLIGSCGDAFRARKPVWMNPRRRRNLPALSSIRGATGRTAAQRRWAAEWAQERGTSGPSLALGYARRRRTKKHKVKHAKRGGYIAFIRSQWKQHRSAFKRIGFKAASKRLALAWKRKR